ncbi:MAG: HAMP domain-containing histidine kinase [Planctomycetes bacterium]|nr:HAMP domain-containing histidine kinase [Planctomycetota bacterium]
MSGSRSAIAFGLILGLSVALLLWWTIFQLLASGELAAAGARLAQGDVQGAARALGAADVPDLPALAARRAWMFASEGVFFGLVLSALTWLYVASVRREANARALQDRFLAGATHELKTPLATMRLLLESLRDGRVPAEKRDKWLATGLFEAERLERGLDNVLTAAGLRATRPKAKRTPGDLAVDVATAVEAMRGRALAGGVTLEVDCDGAATWLRDAAAIQLVVRNLLDNAIKFSPAGATVRVRAGVRDGIAHLEVRDQGRGLDSNEKVHAFEPFWRGSDAASGGTGLGLHLVQQFVQAHDGSVCVHSDGRDRGCTFTLQLPIGARS